MFQLRTIIYWAVPLAVTMFCVGVVSGQPSGLEFADPLAEIPPALELTEDYSSVAVDGGGVPDGASLELLGVLEGFPAQGEPAPAISSGTWFRRGFWYAEQDVVILNRDSLSDVLLAGDVLSTQNLTVESDKPGAAATARLTLGRFLYRDEGNHDHSAEFTFHGIGEWLSTGSIEDTVVGQDDLITQAGNGDGGIAPPTFTGFDGTSRQRFVLDSEFNSFEINYRLRHRPGRDRLVLGPDGHWTRQITPSTFHSYLFGIRYFQLDEHFRWVAFSENPMFRRGDLRIKTSNDLFGLQIGGDLTHQRARFSLGVRGKAGPYVNFSGQNSTLDAIDFGGPVTRHDEVDEDTFAFIAEMGVFVRYHFHPNVSLRTSYEALWLTSVALAAEQVNAPTGVGPEIRSGGGQMFQGLSFGVDFYW